MTSPARPSQAPVRARVLEFRSFAMLALLVFVYLTGLFTLAFFFIPVISAAGLAFAVGAWQISERQPRWVAPVSAAAHLLVLLAFGSVLLGVWKP